MATELKSEHFDVCGETVRDELAKTVNSQSTTIITDALSQSLSGVKDMVSQQSKQVRGGAGGALLVPSTLQHSMLELVSWGFGPVVQPPLSACERLNPDQSAKLAETNDARSSL